MPSAVVKSRASCQPCPWSLCSQVTLMQAASPTWDPSTSSARIWTRNGRRRITWISLTREWAEAVAPCLKHPEFWPDECLNVIIIKTLCSNVPATTRVSRSLQRSLIVFFFFNTFHFQSLVLLSLLLNFQYKHVSRWCSVSPKLKQHEHLSSDREHLSMTGCPGEHRHQWPGPGCSWNGAHSLC